jgi:hypothetical protein
MRNIHLWKNEGKQIATNLGGFVVTCKGNNNKKWSRFTHDLKKSLVGVKWAWTVCLSLTIAMWATARDNTQACGSRLLMAAYISHLTCVLSSLSQVIWIQTVATSDYAETVLYEWFVVFGDVFQLSVKLTQFIKTYVINYLEYSIWMLFD